MIKTVQVKASDAPFGSYIEEDIFLSDDIILVGKGTIVDTQVQRLLRQYEEECIVSYEVPASLRNLPGVADSFDFSGDVRDRAIQGVEYMYSNHSNSSAIMAAVDVSSLVLNCVGDRQDISINLNNLRTSDNYTYRHCLDVAIIGVFIARKLGLKQDAINSIAVSGVLHDLGKCKIREEILNKPGRLTDEEFAIMKKHSLYGYEIVRPERSLSDDVKQGILMHHENVDGSGYPLGKRSRHINYIAKILAVADVYDALVTKRPYRNNIIEPPQALEILLSMKAKFAPDLLQAFLSCVEVYPNGSVVLLSDGTFGRVTKQNEGSPLKPEVIGVDTCSKIQLTQDLKIVKWVRKDESVEFGR